jgi:hypothetical protein
MDAAWIWLLFFTGGGDLPVFTGPVPQHTFLALPRGAMIVVPSAPLARRS